MNACAHDGLAGWILSKSFKSASNIPVSLNAASASSLPTGAAQLRFELKRRVGVDTDFLFVAHCLPLQEKPWLSSVPRGRDIVQT